MFKKVLFLMAFIVMTSVYSQNFLGKGDQKLQAGFNFYGNGSGIKATYDYGLNDMFSIGIGGVFYNSGTYDSKFFLFGRGDFHFAEALEVTSKLDLYLGVELGLVGDGELGLGGHLGTRYLISNSVSIFAEAGNNGALGIAVNL
jgi:hypothetical protein